MSACFLAAHHLPIKQQSPGSQNGRASNLRVVIPPSIAPNMSVTAEDVAYADVSRAILIKNLPSYYFFPTATTKSDVPEHTRGHPTDAHARFD